jgi:hypothetical protein
MPMSKDDVSLHSIADQPNKPGSSAPKVIKVAGSAVIPPSLIAGRIPASGASRAEEAVFNVASLALDTERVALIFTIKSGFIFYMACASQDLASATRGACCPLSAALPGQAGHQGPGLYILESKDLVACVLLDERGLRTFVGEPEVAAQFPLLEAAEHATHFRIEAGERGARQVPWTGYGEMQRASVRRQSSRIAYAGAAAALVGCALWAYADFSNAKVDDQFRLFRAAVEAELGERPAALDRGELAASSKVWRDYAQLSAFALRKDGRLLNFNADEVKASWQLEIAGAGMSDELLKSELGNVQFEVVSRGEKWLIRSGSKP